LAETSRRYWEVSRKLDLSDEGLPREMDRHGISGASKLAFNIDKYR
jgi:hypothetical protein